MRPPYRWQLRTRTLELGRRTLIMGVVNVTPDSFSDGGECLDPKDAVERSLAMLDEGADIIDVGGESTRPGTAVGAEGEADGERAAVSEEEELGRVLPVIRGILQARPEAVISLDTYKSAVARAAVAEGAEIINDVSGLVWDSSMAAACAEAQCGVVVMHTRGTPKQWRNLPAEPDILSVVEHDLANRLQLALERGIKRQRLVLDPGFGFGKNFDENYAVLAQLDRLQRLGFPLLAGTSRKGFIGRAIGERRTAGLNDQVSPNQRLYGSLAAMVTSILRGAHIVRVHDLKASVEAAAVADAVLRAEGN